MCSKGNIKLLNFDQRRDINVTALTGLLNEILATLKEGLMNNAVSDHLFTAVVASELAN